MAVTFQLITLIFVWISSSLSSKSTFTLDEFFNYTEFLSLTLAPDDGQSILIQTKHHIWDRNVNEDHLHLQTLRDGNRKLITTQASSFKPQWKGDLIALILASSSTTRNKQKNSSDESQYIHLYSIRTGETFPLLIGNEEIHAFTWSTTSMSLYFATRTPWSEEVEEAYENEWKDVIQYREQHRGDTIYRADIENMIISKIEPLTNLSLPVVELICSSDGNQLIFSTQAKSLNRERITDYELYSLDLTGHSPLIPLRLTNNLAIERNLKWSIDGLLFFTVTGGGSIEGDYEDSQGRLYSLNITTNRIERWANQFKGEVTDYALLQGGREGVVILGQLSTEIQVYTQLSVNANLIKSSGWNGSYQNIGTVSDGNSSTIVFIHSSYETPQEVYFTDNIDQLNMAQPVTSENKLFTERSLPKGKSYRWFNEDDRTEIEGVLLYPPEKFEEKNLPLLVLIHGGPYDADLNIFRANWYYCAGMMATEGWLVLQPNYRGSTGM
jgi:dipeptidyl aminopeptidase/acylaminoacyl peptidase